MQLLLVYGQVHNKTWWKIQICLFITIGIDAPDFDQIHLQKKKRMQPLPSRFFLVASGQGQWKVGNFGIFGMQSFAIFSWDHYK